MLRRLFVPLVISLAWSSCVPLEYVEPVRNTSARRSNDSRDFYHSNLSDPIQIAYQNGASKGSVYYNIDDPYLDIELQGRNSHSSMSTGEMVSKKDMILCIDFYVSAQKAIIKDDLNQANIEISKALELIEIQPFYDLKGSLYYLSGDTASADYYWNYLK